MKKGIFRRLLLTYVFIFVVIIGIFSVSLSQFFRVYFFEDKQRELLDMGRQVETYLIMYHRGDISKEELTRQINTIGHAVNARVLVIESNKSQLALQKQGIGSEFNDLLKDVISGNVVVKRQQYASELDSYVVAVGLPVQVLEGKKGAILLFSPVYEVDTALAYVYRIILIAALVSLGLGLILVWSYSRKISTPIINLSSMAGQIAEGKSVPDISDETGGEIGQLIRSFNYMKNRLAMIDRMRQEFIADVSHELRTPLTSVRGFIQGILDGIVPTREQNKYLEMAFRETGRLTRLTNDLLELTKLEAGAVTLKKEKVNLSELLEESVMTAPKVEGTQNTSPEIEVVPPDLTLQADPDRLKQILINLLNNAFKFSPENGRIVIKAVREGANVKIEISDSGIGIPEEELPLVFEKFHRVDKSRSSSIGGTGLGLSIVRNLVELHGGSISVASTLGVGTTFTVVMPVGKNC